MVLAPESLASLNAEQLCELARDLIAKIANKDQELQRKDREIKYRQAKTDTQTRHQPKRVALPA